LFFVEDWQFERGSYTYYLGDPINFEVSAIMGNHMPLRVYVEHCVATATPDAEATLRYDFIENHGYVSEQTFLSCSQEKIWRSSSFCGFFELNAIFNPLSFISAIPDVLLTLT